MTREWEQFPGAELILEGLRDVADGRDSIAALIVHIGAPRLSALGFAVPARLGACHPEHQLYERLAGEDSRTAHSRYNALIRRLVSFERAAACVD